MTIGQDDIDARARAFAENMRHRARDGKDGQVVKVDTQPLGERMDFLAKQLENLSGRMTEMAARLENVEARPHVSEETVRQLNDGLISRFQTTIEKLVNKAVGDVRSRLVTVEKTVERVEQLPTRAGHNDEGEAQQLTRLADVVRSMGQYVQTISGDLDARNEDLERRYAEISEHMQSVNEHIADINADALRTKTMFYRALQAFKDDEDAA